MGLLADITTMTRAGARLARHPATIWRELQLLLRSNATLYYDFLGDDVLESKEPGFLAAGRPLWLNLGYWEHAHTYADACVALARRVAELARLRAGDRLLDAGFGFGDQDLLWVREYGVAHITGLNTMPLQVEVAQRRVAEHGLGDRIDLKLGSATALPLADASLDKVIALESAFHFDTRERFFAEAFRVLTPGGRLTTADCIPYPGEQPTGIANRLSWRRWAIPKENIYDRDVYRDRLLQAGFVEPEVESIRQLVFPGMYRYAEQRARGVARGAEHVELSAEDIAQCIGVEDWRRHGGLTDYVLFTASKPA